jgi:hypothetical protein
MNMRRLITLVEGTSPPSLSQVHAEHVLERLERADIETGNWLMRAFETLGDNRPEPFLRMLSDEIDKAKQALSPFDGAVITLYRGLTRGG